jgi:hypothetical protein
MRRLAPHGGPRRARTGIDAAVRLCDPGPGHAYMRAYNEELPLALRMCARLPRADVVD